MVLYRYTLKFEDGENTTAVFGVDGALVALLRHVFNDDVSLLDATIQDGDNVINPSTSVSALKGKWLKVQSQGYSFGLRIF